MSSPRCKILALQNDNDLSRFMANNQIHYISYARQSPTLTEVYRSADLKIYEHWLDAPNCFYPSSDDPKSIMMPWAQYCSREFLQWVNCQFGLADKGTCLVLKHAHFSEYVSVSSSNPNLDLHRILLNDSHFKLGLIQTVRGKACQSTQRRIPSCFDAANLKLNRNNSTSSVTDNVREYGGLSSHSSFIIGNNGLAKLSVKEKIVLQELLSLKPAKNISSLHHISIKTVENITARIRLKLGVSSRHEMYLVAKRNQLV